MKKIQGNFHWPLLLVAGMSLTVSSCSVDGSVLFKEKGCIQCHSYKGKGGRMGPDLTTVGDRLSVRQIRNYIKNPSAQNPKARMPIISNLSTTEIWALASYLKKGND